MHIQIISLSLCHSEKTINSVPTLMKAGHLNLSHATNKKMDTVDSGLVDICVLLHAVNLTNTIYLPIRKN